MDITKRPGNKQFLKRLVRIIIFIFVLMNVIAMFHAYKFTHFSATATVKINPDKLSSAQKLGVVLFGVSNPRPVNDVQPSQPFTSVVLKSNKQIACWYIKADNAKGTVLLFHGYQGNKSKLIDESDEFHKLGYTTLLVDFMGSGGSEGDQTTIGYKEAEEVKTCYDYIKGLGERHIFLSGNSMGAVAILKAIADDDIKPEGIIIGCPFGTMYRTVCRRFEIMNVPKFPMAGLLMFWGGVENGFWAFGHNPDAYAKNIHCPTLLIYGQKDNRVGRDEINAVYNNLAGTKTLAVYPQSGHGTYLADNKAEWIRDISGFLKQNNN